jgi:serine/threonine-protein kinase RsbT
MSPLYHRLSATLVRYLSAVTADTVLRRALRDAAVVPETLDAGGLTRMTPHLDRGIRLFVAIERQDRLRSDLARLVSATHEPPPPQVIPIRAESHISDARLAARAICSETGARPLSTQKVATIVSELARNIVTYTPGGSLEITVLALTPPRLRIVAVDEGKGILHLNDVMTGRYKSRTGLGRGLLGVKRLAETFDLRTGASGTRVEVEVLL